MDKIRFLFVHRHFPGQFHHLAAHLGRDHTVVGIRAADSDTAPPVAPGVKCVTYRAATDPTSSHRYVRSMEAAVRRGQEVARVALDLRRRGFRPDVIFAHPGWGEALYLKDVFPEARLIGYFEFFYRAQGADVGFDPEFPVAFEDRLRIRTRNAINLLSLEACDWGVTPSRWQLGLHPTAFQSRLSVIPDGIDTGRIHGDPLAVLSLPGGERLTGRDEVVTFVARDLEPYRAFHVFMRALPAIMERRPQARIVVAGGDGTSYGPPPPQGSWRERMLAELSGRLDLSRVVFLGRVPFEVHLQLLRVSAVHIYLTYPFVLSWSCLEAMASECAVVASATPPVTEVVEDGVNGLLADFLSPRSVADAVIRVLEHPDRMAAMRARARETVVQRCDFTTVALPRYQALIKSQLAARNLETPSLASGLEAFGAEARATVP